MLGRQDSWLCLRPIQQYREDRFLWRPAPLFRRRRLSVVGAWRDGAGVGCHVISQYGNQLVVNNYDPATGAFRATGLGTVRGRNIHLT